MRRKKAVSGVLKAKPAHNRIDSLNNVTARSALASNTVNDRLLRYKLLELNLNSDMAEKGLNRRVSVVRCEPRRNRDGTDEMQAYDLPADVRSQATETKQFRHPGCPLATTYLARL